MNIVLESQLTADIRQKYLLLELDSFWLPDHHTPVAAYCLLEPLAPDQMIETQQFVELHGNLMHSYRKKNWNYVEQAIGYLMGRWNGQLDSFYQEVLQRVIQLRDQDLDSTWDGVVDRRCGIQTAVGA